MKWMTREQVRNAAERGKMAALDASIKHWEQLHCASKAELFNAYKDKKIGLKSNFCALCLAYHSSRNCGKCVVTKYSKICEEDGSKWERAVNAFYDFLNSWSKILGYNGHEQQAEFEHDEHLMKCNWAAWKRACGNMLMLLKHIRDEEIKSNPSKEKDVRKIIIPRWVPLKLYWEHKDKVHLTCRITSQDSRLLNAVSRSCLASIADKSVAIYINQQPEITRSSSGFRLYIRGLDTTKDYIYTDVIAGICVAAEVITKVEILVREINKWGERFVEGNASYSDLPIFVSLTVSSQLNSQQIKVENEI